MQLTLMENRLARETSPYLQQHAHNPVDWYAWGPEALEAASRDDKPILLSIGYSACHWCHVMERESFENEGIARQMNEGFVNIKVDREERPDLDQVYQLVVQLMGRSGGWPLTVFLTPGQKPFFGGTYFPPADRYGVPGFPKVLHAVSEAYRLRREDVDAQSNELTKAIEEAAAAAGANATTRGTPSAELLQEGTKRLAARFDDVHGGFGSRPKFPNTMSLEVLLRSGDHARVRKALDAMRAGGIWDHLGGGFHRYSTDERWLVPHFEKMLYDNALLLRLYADAARALGDVLYAETAAAIAAYVAREMTALDGAFYATQDADSEGEEGKFFVWTPQEIDLACAGDEDAARAAKRVYGVTDEGNFEQSGATVLSLVHPPRDAAEAAALERARVSMLQARDARPKPFRDEKILASFGALMVGALAHAASILGPAAVAAAEKAMRVIERHLVVREEGNRARVLRHFKDGVVKRPGFLDDHAFVADAALDLYEATGDPHWVSLARAIADAILAHFHDARSHDGPLQDAPVRDRPGGFYFTADDTERILVRAKDPYDHAIPSGATMASRVLLRLGTLVDPKYAEPAVDAVERHATAAAQNPLGMSGTLALADRLVRGSVDIVLVGPRSSPATQALAREVLRTYLPDRVLGWADPSDPRALAACQALAEGKPLQSEPVAYVCRGRICSLPLHGPEALAAALASS
ncbi:MAG: thioredoxin domain-containing protein [Myxococcota bacterium]|nr:thioredoxin domain-containing protein [Myxococcota bacterium]